MYKSTPRRVYLARVLADSLFPTCYNGDFYTVPAPEVSQVEFPATERIMLGRGLAGSPALTREAESSPVASRGELWAFYNQVYGSCTETLGNRRNVTLRMKGVWLYPIHLLGGSQWYAKATREARDTDGYEGAVAAVLRELKLLPELRPER